MNLCLLSKVFLANKAFSGKKKQRIKDREDVRRTTVQILESMYDLVVFRHGQTHLNDSTARDISIDCQEVKLQTNGSQSSPFSRPWTPQVLNRYPLDYANQRPRPW